MAFGRDDSQGFFGPLEDAAGNLLEFGFELNITGMPRQPTFKPLLQPEDGFQKGAVVGPPPAPGQVLIGEA